MVDFALSAGRFHSNTHLSANCNAIGFHSSDLQSYPVICAAGVYKQAVVSGISFQSAAKHNEDVLLAVVVEVPKGNSVALLKVAESSRRGDLIEVLASVVAKHT